jgi:hypothetical protein
LGFNDAPNSSISPKAEEKTPLSIQEMPQWNPTPGSNTQRYLQNPQISIDISPETN